MTTSTGPTGITAASVANASTRITSRCSVESSSSVSTRSSISNHLTRNPKVWRLKDGIMVCAMAVCHPARRHTYIHVHASILILFNFTDHCTTLCATGSRVCVGRHGCSDMCIPTPAGAKCACGDNVSGNTVALADNMASCTRKAFPIIKYLQSNQFDWMRLIKDI